MEESRLGAIAFGVDVREIYIQGVRPETVRGSSAVPKTEQMFRNRNKSGFATYRELDWLLCRHWMAHGNDIVASNQLRGWVASG